VDFMIIIKSCSFFSVIVMDNSLYSMHEVKKGLKGI